MTADETTAVGRVLTCAYCGKEDRMETTDVLAEHRVMDAHIMECTKRNIPASEHFRRMVQDGRWPKRAEIIAVLSAHYGAPAESVEEWLTEYFSW